MRIVKTFLALALLSLAVAASAQTKIPFAAGRGVQDTAYTPGSLLFLGGLRMPFYANSSSNTGLAVDAQGKVIMRTFSGGGGGAVDSSVYATRNFVLTQGYGPGTVSSVGLSMPAAFSVTGSPITSAGSLTVSMPGLVSQYLRGNGTLATFPYIPDTAQYYTKTASNTRYLQNITGLVTAGTNVTVTGSGTSGSPYVINSTASGGGGGTVTSISVATANGFAGTVANSTTTPSITLSTTATGLLKGNGTAISAATAGTDYLAPFGSQTANTFYAAPNGSAGTASFRAIVPADVPTLNQNTTGSAATLTTSRSIYGSSFNGSADLAGPVTVPYGGTGLTTATPYAIFLGGTTSTGAHTQVSGLGTSGQVLTSNGSGTAPTWQTAASGGGISGLTTNYLSKATSSTTIGNSQVFDNGTNVGVGTSSPTSKLTVSGDVTASGAVNSVVVNVTGSSGYLQMADANAIGTGYNGNAIQSYGTNLIINGLGRSVLFPNSGTLIGIATASPATQLDVNGDVTVRGYINYPDRSSAPSAPSSGCTTYALSGHLYVICAGESSPTMLH